MNVYEMNALLFQNFAPESPIKMMMSGFPFSLNPYLFGWHSGHLLESLSFLLHLSKKNAYFEWI